jgi:hypothetical protein
MKNKINIILAIVVLTTLLGCKKEEMPSKTVQESFPIIELKGAEVVVLQAGQKYTDPGALVNPGYDEAGNLISDTIAPSQALSADPVTIGTAEGIYFIPYTYRNKYGFESSISRKVVVVSQAYTSNYAGKWKRSSNGLIATWTNLGSGVHAIKDPGGANIPGDILYVIIKNDNTVIVPVQDMGSSANILGLNSISFTPTVVKYAFKAGNGVYGTAVRTFNKQ